MKKIYLSLLLTTSVFVSCMEKERPQPITVYTNTFTTQQPHTANNPYTWQPPVCQANEPGWEFYDAIANMTYNNNQPTVNEIELKPIYKPASTNIAQKEQKLLLQTNSLNPDNDKMQSLYCYARNTLAAEYNKKYGQIALNDNFVGLIIHMNDAKNNGIHEDLMERFSYQKKEEYKVEKYISKYDKSEKNITPLIPLLFILLKKYNTVVQQTGEQLPLHFKHKKIDLNKTLSSSTQIYPETIFGNITNVYDDMAQYPAFFQFGYAVRRFIENLPNSSIKTFTTYIYENDDISQKNYSDGSYKDFKSEFYINAYNTLLHKSTANDLYSLVQMIDRAKKLRDITHEDDLIADIATYFSTNKSAKTKLCSLFSSSYSTDNIAKRITLFCQLIKQYNATKDFKITPTVAQQEVYDVKTFLDIPLPEHLCNNTHLDDTFYAFKEFRQLRNDTYALSELTADEVNELL